MMKIMVIMKKILTIAVMMMKRMIMIEITKILTITKKVTMIMMILILKNNI